MEKFQQITGLAWGWGFKKLLGWEQYVGSGGAREKFKKTVGWEGVGDKIYWYE